MAPLKTSLPMFAEAGFKNLRAKSRAMVGQARAAIAALPGWQILTPDHPQAGNMITLRPPTGKAAFDSLMAEGVIADWREPGIIRFAFCPLYNTQDDVKFALEILSN
jgi:kynureninase